MMKVARMSKNDRIILAFQIFLKIGPTLSRFYFAMYVFLTRLYFTLPPVVRICAQEAHNTKIDTFAISTTK